MSLPDWKALTETDPTGEARLAVIEPYRLKGASATQLSRLFANATRNSVIGFMVRKKVALMGKAGGLGPDAHVMVDDQDRRRQVTQRRVRDGQEQVVPVTRAREPERGDISLIHDDIPMAQRKTLLELSERTCKWPVGDPQAEDFHFCGAPPIAGKPYCKTHDKRSKSTH